jgi:hypothetical protein
VQDGVAQAHAAHGNAGLKLLKQIAMHSSFRSSFWKVAADQDWGDTRVRTRI